MESETKLTCTEFKIPVPWGHIAGKIWGKPTGRRLLLIHGILDNCGVFDRLIPLLKGDFYIVAIDLPGHGFSSHFPVGLPIHYLDFIIAIVYVLQYMKWTRFLYLGHSLGAQIGYFLAALFPEYLERLIGIDHVGPKNQDAQSTESVANTLKYFLQMTARLSSGKPPVYTYQQALDKLTNRNSVLTTEAAKIVLKRSLKLVENGYTLCMDQRLKLNPMPFFSVWHLLDILGHIKCPVLCIFSSERYPIYKKIYRDAFTLIEQKSNFTVSVVLGNHEVHQNHPDRISKLVNDFFCFKTSKL